MVMLIYIFCIIVSLIGSLWYTLKLHSQKEKLCNTDIISCTSLMTLSVIPVLNIITTLLFIIVFIVSLCKKNQK